jgi:ribosomal protein L44E
MVFKIERNCIIVASHPRSGTHLVIDFIRRNFPDYNRKLYPWQTSSYFLYNLDHPRTIVSSDHINSYGNIIIKTHQFRNIGIILDKVNEIVKPRRIKLIYPYRRFSRTLKSFAEFQKFDKSIVEFLERKDEYFNSGDSIELTARAHSECWMESGLPIFLNVDELLSDVDTVSQALSAALEEPLLGINRRVPRKKRLYGGKMSELIQRCTRRESTEVKINYKIACSQSDLKYVDGKFESLYNKLEASKCGVGQGF